MIFYFIVIRISVPALVKGKEPEFNFEHDSQMVMRAFDAVCWFEYMKSFPPAEIGSNTVVKRFPNAVEICSERKRYLMRVQFTYKDEELERKYQGFVDDLPTRLPRWYSCYSPMPPALAKMLGKEPPPEPKPEESAVWGDDGRDFKNKWMATCLIQSLRKKRGDKVLELVKEKVNKELPPNWRELMLERENKYRELHGAGPLKLDESLNEAAQEYANFLQNDNGCRTCPCRQRDMCEKDGKLQGENLCFGENYDIVDMPYLCPNLYYSQGKDYHFPYPSKNQMKGRGFEYGSFEQFAQLLWNSTETVGYGYVGEYRDDRCGEFFLVSRYYPMGGRMDLQEGEFEKNVFPKKE